MGHPARSARDGYTVMFVSTSFIVNPNLYPCVPYDDFAPVTPGDAERARHQSVDCRDRRQGIDRDG